LRALHATRDGSLVLRDPGKNARARVLPPEDRPTDRRRAPRHAVDACQATHRTPLRRHNPIEGIFHRMRGVMLQTPTSCSHAPSGFRSNPSTERIARAQAVRVAQAASSRPDNPTNKRAFAEELET
jgi:hypothetical protein